jgi:cytosine/creatinine deaminase
LPLMTDRKSSCPLLLKGGHVVQDGTYEPQAVDILIDANGRIAAIGNHQIAGTVPEVIDLRGRLVVPGLIDVHQHVDKSRTRRLVKNRSGTLDGALQAYQSFASGVTREDMLARAARTLDTCLAYGTVAIRSHTNIDPQTQCRGVEAMVELRERYADRMTLQIVAHVTSCATRMRDRAKTWLEQAISSGADIIGGVPAISDDPIAFLDMVFGLADKRGLPLDLHIDEHLDGNTLLFEPLVERTEALGLQGRVVASHSSALSAVNRVEAGRIIDKLARSQIAIVTLPAANLFLQGRDAAALPPRGLTRVADLIAAGTLVAAASDNIQDPFVPTGSGDMLEIARWTLLAGHLGLDDLNTAFDMVSRAPATIMGLRQDWGIRPGARADLLITDGKDAGDLVASGSLNRTVMVGGRIVSQPPPWLMS